MDIATQTQLKDTAEKMIAQRAPFSAWNISTAVRKMGFQSNPRDMIKYIHSLYASSNLGDYQQTMIEDKNRPGTTFFLYHPPELDPHTYDPNTGKAQSTGSKALPSVSDVDDDADGDGDDDDDSAAPPVLVGVSARAKTIKQSDGSLVKILGNSQGSVLYVPQTMAAAIGVPAKGPAYMSIDSTSNKISISATGMQKACVDRNRNIRIGKTALLKAGINGQVKVKLDGNEICISKP